MKKVNFCDLDAENKLTAVTQMFNLNHQFSVPQGSIWETEEDIEQDLEKDWNPDEYFTFYIDDFDEVETKIG